MTRLETRTKESNKYASIWVIKTHMRKEIKKKENQILIALLTGSFRGRVGAYLLGPERWWTMGEQVEARGNAGGGPKQYWRANRLSDLPIAAKD